MEALKDGNFVVQSISDMFYHFFRRLSSIFELLNVYSELYQLVIVLQTSGINDIGGASNLTISGIVPFHDRWQLFSWLIYASLNPVTFQSEALFFGDEISLFASFRDESSLALQDASSHPKDFLRSTWKRGWTSLTQSPAVLLQPGALSSNGCPSFQFFKVPV